MAHADGNVDLACLNTVSLQSVERQCVHGEDNFPLRLIDVEATITNSEQGRISFCRRPEWHTISHVWTDDVRNFSRSIGEKLGGGTYDQLFEHADFSEFDSYWKLVEFLKILRLDKVRWVWYDILCINQKDDKEKKREIEHMGTYYESSLGCYVLQHGLGTGFKLLDQNPGIGSPAPSLPRWFNRAWTFQEWILSRKTTFVIDQLENTLTRVANEIILRGSTCWCCFYENSLSPKWIAKCMELSASMGLKGLSQERGSSCRADGPHFREISGYKGGYFVDDLGYIFLVKVQSNIVKVPRIIEPVERMVLSIDEMERLERLSLKMRFDGNSEKSILSEELKTELAIEEISRRDCSYDEDRVLSILKVLGVEGVVEVMTKKTLEQQVLHLVKSLMGKQQEELLVRLCLVDGWGNDWVGMSWAPNFKADKRQEGLRKLAEKWVWWEYFKGFRCAAKVRGVSHPDGWLELEGHVMEGKLVNYDHKVKETVKKRWREEVVKEMALEVDGEVVLTMRARCREDVKDTCMIEAVPSFVSGHGSIVFKASGLHHRLHHLLPRIPVLLLRMGDSHGRSELLMTYFLVCLDTHPDHPLHKVGYLSLPPSCPKLVRASLTRTPTILTIGGFGSDLHPHVLPSDADATPTLAATTYLDVPKPNDREPTTDSFYH